MDGKPSLKRDVVRPGEPFIILVGTNHISGTNGRSSHVLWTVSVVTSLHTLTVDICVQHGGLSVSGSGD